MPNYYNIPTQVLFHDDENPARELAGIAYHDYIICGGGSVIPIDEAVDIIPLTWANLTAVIRK